ncbi:MAG TPA: hypothetical protein VFI52_09670 [Gemmatimonadaceae bacterium]|nr:hypothetical protein [Gemmatimonadaceae bacterium]
MTSDGFEARTESVPSLPGRLWLWLRNGARELRHLPDRLLHPRRRSLARRRLAASAPFQSALFICHGNVCRSPYAAATFERLTRDGGGRVDVGSAGFIGPGRQPPPAALAAAARRDIDMQAHRSQLIAPDRLAKADLIVVMSVEQDSALRTQHGVGRGTLLILGDLDPEPITRRTVRDPWGSDDRIFDESYARIDRCIRELARLHAAGAATRSQR